MDEHELIGKVAELKAAITRANALASEIVFEGCTVTFEHQVTEILGRYAPTPSIDVRVMKEVRA